MATPRPKPTQMKKLEGTLRKDRHSENEPVPSGGLPEAPAWLNHEEYGHFERLVGILDEMQLASSSHVDMLVMLSFRLAQIEELIQDVNENGMSYETITKRGGVKFSARPEVAQLNEALRHAQSLLSEFGLSPSSMSKVSAQPKSKAENPWEKFIN